ncbi:MAG TPA: delta-60 repeat domain-containing protein [Actinomycetota bacterium]|nr:delta-60 repeat domain-containing protein [Actinomycetota bacterium]
MIHRRRILSVLAVAVITGLLALGMAPALALGVTPGMTPDTGCDTVRGKVYSLVETSDHSTLYVGGKFSRVGQSGEHPYFPVSLARFDEATCLGDPSWTPQVFESNGTEPGTVNGMALSPDGSTLYVVGKFALACPSPVGSACETRKNLAAFDTGTGALQPISENIANQVDTVLLASSGDVVTKIYIGGPFKRINGKPAGRLAALDPDGSVDTTWDPQADNTVRTLVWAADGNSIFAGGSFKSITEGGTTYPREAVARLNPVGASPIVNAWTIPAGVIPVPMTAWSLTPSPDGTTLYGGFGAGPNFAAAFRLDDGPVGDQIWRRSTTGNVESTALSPDGAGLFISGHFGTAHKSEQICSGVSAHGLAEINLSTAPTIKYFCWAPHLLPDSLNFTAGWTLLVNPTYLWLAGSFDQICTPDGVTTCVPAGPPGTTSMNIARFTL